MERIIETDTKYGNCEVCNERFEIIKGWDKHRKFCSKACKIKKHNSFVKGNPLNLATPTTGSIAELLVGVDLLRKGYEVYRSLSPACSGDLMIEKNKRIIKVEVKTGYFNMKTKNILFPKKNIKAEILAIVIIKNISSEIIYLEFPSLKKIKI